MLSIQSVNNKMARLIRNNYHRYILLYSIGLCVGVVALQEKFYNVVSPNGKPIHITYYLFEDIYSIMSTAFGCAALMFYSALLLMCVVHFYRYFKIHRKKDLVKGWLWVVIFLIFIVPMVWACVILGMNE